MGRDCFLVRIGRLQDMVSDMRDLLSDRGSEPDTLDWSELSDVDRESARLESLCLLEKIDLELGSMVFDEKKIKRLEGQNK